MSLLPYFHILAVVHDDNDKTNHLQRHAWFSVINRNKIKNSNVFNQPIARNNNNINNNRDVDGADVIDLDGKHQRQLRSVISAAALSSAQANNPSGKNINATSLLKHPSLETYKGFINVYA